MLETKTVSEIINHLKSKDLSIKEVIEYYLNNIEKLNPKLNSIVSLITLWMQDTTLLLRDTT